MQYQYSSTISLYHVHMKGITPIIFTKDAFCSHRALLVLAYRQQVIALTYGVTTSVSGHRPLAYSF